MMVPNLTKKCTLFFAFIFLTVGLVNAQGQSPNKTDLDSIKSTLKTSMSKSGSKDAGKLISDAIKETLASKDLTPAEKEAAVIELTKIAVTADPNSAAEITTAAVKAAPYSMAENIAGAAVEAAPNKGADIVEAAIKAAPKEFASDITRAAVAAAPNGDVAGKITAQALESTANFSKNEQQQVSDAAKAGAKEADAANPQADQGAAAAVQAAIDTANSQSQKDASPR